MAVSSKAYGLAQQSAWSGEINYLGGTVKAMLTTSGYTPDQDNHRYKSSVTNETTGTGYTAGGVTLTGKTTAYDPATNTFSLGADNPAWPTGSTFTFRNLIFYVDTGTAATSPLISYVDFGADVAVNNTTFTATLAGGVVLQSTAAA